MEPVDLVRRHLVDVRVPVGRSEEVPGDIEHRSPPRETRRVPNRSAGYGERAGLRRGPDPFDRKRLEEGLHRPQMSVVARSADGDPVVVDRQLVALGAADLGLARIGEDDGRSAPRRGHRSGVDTCGSILPAGAACVSARAEVPPHRVTRVAGVGRVSRHVIAPGRVEDHTASSRTSNGHRTMPEGKVATSSRGWSFTSLWVGEGGHMSRMHDPPDSGSEIERENAGDVRQRVAAAERPEVGRPSTTDSSWLRTR